MKRVLDLSQLSVPQLLEIRSILAGGVQASADARSIARKLKAENEKLHEKNYRMGIVLSEGLDWFGHEDYWMSFNDRTFQFVVNRMSTAKKATAETKTIRVPQIYSEPELTPIDTIRTFFAERKNSRG